MNISKHLQLSIITIFILFIGIFVFFSQNFPISQPITKAQSSYVPIGKGCTNAYYIDKDCDGYGVASPLGVDADDNDPEVNTPETVIAKYGNLTNFLNYLGYNPERIFYISTNGDDDTGEVNNIDKPYKTWDAVESQLQPGDGVIFRGGRYDYLGDYAITCSNINGTADKPIIIMAYPGENAIIDAAYNIVGFPYSYMIFDGFIADNTGHYTGWGHGIDVKDGSHHLSFKNIDIKHHSCGVKPMAGLHDILVENCVIHDNPYSHGMYFGSREVPNSNLTVRNCIIYRNGRHGFQHNGRVTNLVLENNIIHSNDMGGISLLEGVSNSIVKNNLIFNNNRQGIVFFLYDDSSISTILPYDQTNNLIVNNLIWVGKHKWDGSGDSTADFPAIHFDDATAAQNCSMDENIFRNNILVTYNGPVFRFDQKKFADITTIENNVIYRVRGSNEIMTYGDDVYDFDAFQNFSDLIKNNIFQDPKLSNISIDYYSTPEKFNFDYLSDSPAINFGISTDAPSTDLRGNPRDENPDAGCYEYGDTSTNKPPVANAGNDITVADMDDDWKENVTLDASQSYDPDGQITHYFWTDAITGEELGRGKIITISLDVGIHAITLKVIDNKGTLSYDQIKVTVKEGPNVIRLKNGYEGYMGNSVITLWEGKPEGSDYCRAIAHLGKYAGINRLIIRFDNLTNLLSSVSKNNSIVTAKLRLYNNANNASNHKINIYALKKSFEPQEVCWNNISSDTPWAEPGAYNENDIEMTPISNITLDDKNNIWREWDVTSYVEEIRNGTRQNYGWLLKQEDESSGYSFYRPEEDNSTALRPELVIRFQSSISFTVVTETLPDGIVNQVYSIQLQAVGGNPPYTFSLVSGSLPNGISLSSNGTLSGTPTQIGTFTFTIQVKDSNNNTSTKQFSLTINPAQLIGDLNHDSKVNSQDFQILIQKFKQTEDIENEDLNSDGIVDVKDIGILMHYWKE